MNHLPEIDGFTFPPPSGRIMQEEKKKKGGPRGEIERREGGELDSLAILGERQGEGSLNNYSLNFQRVRAS